MCSPLAALSPAAAMMTKKPGIATALISPAAALLTSGNKKPRGTAGTATGAMG